MVVPRWLAKLILRFNPTAKLGNRRTTCGRCGLHRDKAKDWMVDGKLGGLFCVPCWRLIRGVRDDG